MAKINHAHRPRMCKTPIVMYFAGQKFRVTPDSLKTIDIGKTTELYYNIIAQWEKQTYLFAALKFAGGPHPSILRR